MSDLKDLVQDMESEQALRTQMLEAMMSHLSQSADALHQISWDKLDARGMIDYSQAHATLAMALAQALKARE